MTHLGWVVFLGGALGACGGSTGKAETAPAVRRFDVERYLPLTDGTVYTYETSSANSGETGILMLEVVRRNELRAELVVAGRPQLLELGPDGARHATGGYLLRQPLFANSEYKGSFGNVRVTSTSERITTPAGTFEQCVETIEENSTKRARTLFCPEVGMVLLEVEGLTAETAGLERAILRAFGPRVDLSMGPPSPKSDGEAP
jgi:hypothetical protein